MSNSPSQTRNSKLLFLFGPTGVGKTDLLLNFFTHGFSVVNADSKQVYRHLDIGSAKPSAKVLSSIPHYLIDIRDPWEQFTVGDFVNLADETCGQIVEQGRIPIICGGTAYYFKHFYLGLPPSPQSDPVIREKIARQAIENGLPWCFERLRVIDPLSATRIHPADAYRITRALEVYEATGKPLSSFVIPTEARHGMDPLIIGLVRPKQELDERINLRVTGMFEAGLEQEFQHLLSLGAKESWPGMQGIGYREFFIAQQSAPVELESVANMIRHNSRLYAKRQMTFFKSLPNVHWVHPDDTDTLGTLLDDYLSRLS
ncbi:MAG: tRNA (adenosine(37)-N6)-dimethylallyltransferase MiaA [Sphaerochaetaceae bacterium]